MVVRTDDEKRRIGREIKTFLAVNGIARETFAERVGLGKSTVDKLITGIFSEESLAKVLEKSNFRLRTSYAAAKLGGYSRANWEGYASPYLMLIPALDGSAAIDAARSSIVWDDHLPGLVLSAQDPDTGQSDPLGAIWIPHERSPLIYIQPVDEIGVRLVVTTMIGVPIMRGLMLAVENSIANAWIPVAAPVALKRLEEVSDIKDGDIGRILPDHPSYGAYSEELDIVMQRQFGRMATAQGLA